jgi:hypothetical protein
VGGLECVVRPTQAHAIVGIVRIATIAALLDVVCEHSMTRRGLCAALTILNPFAAIARASNHGLAKPLMLFTIVEGIDPLGSGLTVRPSLFGTSGALEP